MRPDDRNCIHFYWLIHVPARLKPIIYQSLSFLINFLLVIFFIVQTLLLLYKKNPLRVEKPIERLILR